MTKRPSMWVRAFEDLKRRKVFRVAAAYAVVAWLVVQAGSIVLPSFETPAWVLRALIFFAFAGFPAAVILAWIFDITPGGVVRTAAQEEPGEPPSPPAALWARYLLGVVALAVIAGGGWWVWSDRFAERGSSFLRERTESATPVIAALAMRNLTGNRELDWLGEGLANLVRDNLAQSRYLAVVSGSRTRQLQQALTQPGTGVQEAGSEGIDYLLSGEILRAPSGLTLSVRLTDLDREVEVEGDRFDGLGPETLLETASRVAGLAKRGLRIPRTEKVDVFAADFATENLSAYEAFIAGMQYFVDYKYRDAEQSFRTALELAPDFSIARYRLAHIQAATGRTDEALANIREAAAAEYLPERERLYIAAAEAWFARDYAAAEQRYRALLERFPYEVEARLHLSHVLSEHGRYDEAIEELLFLTEQEPENQVVWSLLGETYLLTSRLDEARASLERFAALAPDSANAHILLGDAHFYQGQLDAARREYEQARILDPALATSRINLALVDFLSGEQQAARQTLRAVVNDADVPPRYRLDAAFSLAWLLQAVGRFEDADGLMASLADPLAAEKIRESLGLAVRALSRMELGDHAQAAALIARAIEFSPGPPTRYLFARGLLELARGDIEAAWNTASEIGTHALPEGDPDRTEEKAAAYLNGLGYLRSRQLPAALDALRAAVKKEGYSYRIYELGLAEALLESGDGEAAARVLDGAIVERNPLEPRLDLELDRQRGRLLAARIAAENGETTTARRLAQQFLDQLAGADAQVRDLETAREILAGTN